MRAIKSVILVGVLAATTVLAFAQDARSLVNDAMSAYQSKEFARSAELFDQAITKGASSQNTLYNAACSHALAGHADRALALLDQAIAKGWRDATHMAADTDLSSLHADPRWAPTLAKAKAVEEAYFKTVNGELAKITAEDQADRAVSDPEQIDWKTVSERDAKRRARVYEIIKAGQLKHADDYFNAALVLQHGDKPDDYDMAHKLAAKSAELDPNKSEARWLSAAAKDRYLWATGKPQIYGTQFKKVGEKWTIDPIDEAAVTDAERQKQGVPTLAETRKRLEQMNAKP
jgi:hypothetical protein